MVEALNPEKDTIPNAMWYNLSKTIFIKSKVDQTIIETNVRNDDYSWLILAHPPCCPTLFSLASS